MALVGCLFPCRVLVSLSGACFLVGCLYTSLVLRVGAPAGAFSFLQKQRLIYFECIQVPCYGWTLLQGLFVFLKNTVLYFLVRTSPVLRVDVSAGTFCFLRTHLLIFLSVYRSCVMDGRSRRGFLFASKTRSYVFECIQVLCYRWTLPQGLFVFFKNTFVYF